VAKRDGVILPTRLKILEGENVANFKGCVLKTAPWDFSWGKGQPTSVDQGGGKGVEKASGSTGKKNSQKRSLSQEKGEPRDIISIG